MKVGSDERRSIGVIFTTFVSAKEKCEKGESRTGWGKEHRKERMKMEIMRK
jgi:hypothetical protein